jgi:hypothetical protein
MQHTVKDHVEKRARFDKTAAEPDPDIALLNTGPVRNRFDRGYAKKQRRDQPARNGKWCLDCGKQGYATEAAARDVLGNVAKYGHLKEAGSFAMQPYMCVHGWWHIGRNYKVLKAFSDIQKKREKLNFPFLIRPDRVKGTERTPAASRRANDVHNAIDCRTGVHEHSMEAAHGKDQDPIQGEAPEAVWRGHAFPHLVGTLHVVPSLRA